MHYIYFFGLQIDVNPIAFTLPFGDGWNVYWYGIIITVGFVLAVLYAMKRARKFGVNPDRLLTCVLVGAVVAILSGRAYYIMFNSNMDFTQFFNIHGGGMAIPGAIIGAVIAAIVMCKIEKIDLFSTFDLAALGFLIGQCVGRWGNFMNQEAYGSFTGSTWFGMTGDVISSDVGSTQLVHPCFFYESIWCLIGFILLHFISKKRKFKGEIGVIYMIWYGFGRFVIEGLRTDALMLGAVRVTQWLMAVVCIAGVVLLIIGLKKAKLPDEMKAKAYVPVFDEVEAEKLNGSDAIVPDDKISDEQFVDDQSEKSTDNIKINVDAVNTQPKNDDSDV